MMRDPDDAKPIEHKALHPDAGPAHGLNLVVHDLNNLLGIVLGSLDLLRDPVSAGVTADELVARATKAAEAATRLVGLLWACRHASAVAEMPTTTRLELRG
jgi:hypothetical protein